MQLGDPLASPERLVKKVYAYVAYRVGDGPHAEDITSETFERALQYRHTYDGNRGEVIGWLIGIARRCIWDAADAEATVTADVPEMAAGGDLDTEVVRRLDLAAALARLDERSRELVALRYGADLTARQIGDMLGMRTNAVEVALHRALGRLRELLGSEEAQEKPLRSATARSRRSPT